MRMFSPPRRFMFWCTEMSGYEYVTDCDLCLVLSGYEAEEAQPVEVTVELSCVAYGTPEYIPAPTRPDLYDPGAAPEFEFVLIRLSGGTTTDGKKVPDLTLTDRQAEWFLGDRIVTELYELAVEAAIESGEFG